MLRRSFLRSILLSVIVPVFNSDKFLQDALNCLKKQTCNNIEFLIINDGSIDNSLEIIKRFCEHDKRFTCISKSQNLGYGQSCNLGILKSSGQYIAFFEPDDLIPDDFYEILLEKARDAQVLDVIKYNGIYSFDAFGVENRVFQMKDFPNSIFDRDEYPRFWRTHPAIVNAIYKKDFLVKNNLYFPESAGASYQDVQFLTSLYYGRPKLLIVDFCKYKYRIHPDQSVQKPGVGIEQRVIQNWEYLFDEILSETNQQDMWFALIQMYRQFCTMSKKFPDAKFEQFNIFFSKQVWKYGMVRPARLKWFALNNKEMMRFYFLFAKGFFKFLF